MNLHDQLVKTVSESLRKTTEIALRKGYELGWMEAREYFGVVGPPTNQEVRAREDGATHQVTEYKKNLDERITDS